MLVEVNCETDFVARGDVFKELANDMAMQVAACSQVTVVDSSQVPADVVDKERNVQMGKEDILKKPEAIRSVSLMLSLTTPIFEATGLILGAHRQIQLQHSRPINIHI